MRKSQDAMPGSQQQEVMLRLRADCRRLQTEYEAGRISKRLVMRKLLDLASDAYKAIPDAEPDGEITYCVASTVDAIESAQHNDEVSDRRQ